MSESGLVASTSVVTPKLLTTIYEYKWIIGIVCVILIVFIVSYYTGGFRNNSERSDLIDKGWNLKQFEEAVSQINKLSNK